MPPFEHVLRGSSEGIVRGPGEWVVFSPKGWGVPVCVRAWSLQLCASPFSLLVVVSSLPSHVEKSPHKSPAWFAIPPPRAKDAGSTTVLLWLVAGCLAGKQPAYTRAVPRVLRQSERVLPPWLWSPSGGVPNMAGSRTARSPVASAPFPARGLHPSTPSRPARGVTSGRESAFPTCLGPRVAVRRAYLLRVSRLVAVPPVRVPVCARAQEEGGSKASPREVWGRGGLGEARGFLAAGSRVRGSGCALSGAVRGWRRAPICGRPALWAARRCPGLLWVRSRFREGLAPSPGAGGGSS